MSRRVAVPLVGLLLVAVAVWAWWDYGSSSARSGDLERLAPSVEAGLSEWLAVWRQGSPALDLTQFQREHEGAMSAEREYYEAPYDPANPQVASFTNADLRLKAPLLLYSPDRTRFIDLYLGLEMEERDGRVVAGWDVDAGVALVDLSRKKWMRLLYCGPSCGYDDAMWIDNDTFVVVGYYEDISSRCPGRSDCVVQPYLWLYRVSANTVTWYVGPAVPKEALVGHDGYNWRRIRERIPNLADPN